MTAGAPVPLRGEHGPEAAARGAVAAVLTPELRPVVEGLCSRLAARSPVTAAELRAYLVAMEHVAATYLAAGGTAGGESERSGPCPGDPPTMTTTQTAAALEVSERTARGLGPTLGRKVGRDWVFDPAAVAAHRDAP